MVSVLLCWLTPNLFSSMQPAPRGQTLRRRSVRAGWTTACCLLLLAPNSPAGSGRVNSNGTIDISVGFRFPPTPADLATVSNQVLQASMALWDASDGQLRFGNVTFTAGVVNEDLA